MTDTEFAAIYNTAVLLRDGSPRNVLTYSTLRATSGIVKTVTLETFGPDILWCTTGLYGNGIAYTGPWASWDGQS